MVKICKNRSPWCKCMRRTYHPTSIVNGSRDRITAHMDIWPATCFEALAFPFECLTDLIELSQFFCKNQVVHTMLIFDFSGRDDGDAGLILKIRLPAFLPDRMECIS